MKLEKLEERLVDLHTSECASYRLAAGLTYLMGDLLIEARKYFDSEAEFLTWARRRLGNDAPIESYVDTAQQAHEIAVSIQRQQGRPN